MKNFLKMSFKKTIQAPIETDNLIHFTELDYDDDREEDLLACEGFGKFLDRYKSGKQLRKFPTLANNEYSSLNQLI